MYDKDAIVLFFVENFPKVMPPKSNKTVAKAIIEARKIGGKAKNAAPNPAPNASIVKNIPRKKASFKEICLD